MNIKQLQEAGPFLERLGIIEDCIRKVEAMGKLLAYGRTTSFFSLRVMDLDKYDELKANLKPSPAAALGPELTGILGLISQSSGVDVMGAQIITPDHLRNFAAAEQIIESELDPTAGLILLEAVIKILNKKRLEVLNSLSGLGVKPD
jgi:hypothetical protein